MLIPNEDKNPKEPKENESTGGQGIFWKMEEMCKRVPSPPQETIIWVSFKRESDSSAKNETFE